MDKDGKQMRDSLQAFSDSQVDAFEQLARRPDIYDVISRSIAPPIYGNTGNSCT